MLKQREESLRGCGSSKKGTLMEPREDFLKEVEIEMGIWRTQPEV